MGLPYIFRCFKLAEGVIIRLFIFFSACPTDATMHTCLFCDLYSWLFVKNGNYNYGQYLFFRSSELLLHCNRLCCRSSSCLLLITYNDCKVSLPSLHLGVRLVATDEFYCCSTIYLSLLRRPSHVPAKIFFFTFLTVVTMRSFLLWLFPILLTALNR